MNLVIVAVLGLVVVGIVVLLVVRIRAQRSTPKFEVAAEEIANQDKAAVLRYKSQSKSFPAIPIIVQLVSRSPIPQLLEQADLAQEVTVEDVAKMKLMLMVLFGVVGAVLGLLLQSPVFVALALLGGLALGFRSPDSSIQSAATLRQNKISRALPLALEVIGLAVEKTSIDSGVDYYCRYFPQEILAQELGYTVQRVQQLKERLDVAMIELLRKNKNDDLSFLVAAVGQATQLGGRDLRSCSRGSPRSCASSASRRSRPARCGRRC